MSMMQRVKGRSVDFTKDVPFVVTAVTPTDENGDMKTFSAIIFAADENDAKEQLKPHLPDNVVFPTIALMLLEEARLIALWYRYQTQL